MGDTRGSYNKRYLVVSYTEPENPSDGLLWYKPDLCTTTTTGLPCEYEGVLTVGSYADGVYGYAFELCGSIDPIDNTLETIIWVNHQIPKLYVSSYECYDEITLYINDVPYLLPFLGGEDIYAYEVSSSNPFPAIDETCNIRVCYGTPCTTTTTCVPIGNYEYSTDFASSYTPVIGLPISFIGSVHDTCEAIDVVNIQQMGAFDWFGVDVYTVDKDTQYYLHGTCTLLPTGYYVYNGEGGFGVHVTDGIIDQYNICETTTTTTPQPQ